MDNLNYQLGWESPDGTFRSLMIAGADIEFHLKRLREEGSVLISLRLEGF